MTTISLHFGALVPQLKEQLEGYGVDSTDIEHFQKDADAIVRLAIRGLIPDSTKITANRRLMRNIVKAIK